MSDNTNPNGQATPSAVSLLPRYYQTADNIKFIQSTIDQLTQKGTTKKVTGYIGRENSKSSNVARTVHGTAQDVFIKAVDSTRQHYQLEPAVVINDKYGNPQFFKDYQDYINQLMVFGGNVSNHERLNRQEYYSWNPHIDWDKFVNFQQYYWLPYGPETIKIFGQQLHASSTYSVDLVTDVTTKAYVFTPNGLDRNPGLVLYRGQTYTFVINSAGEPFSIKLARTSGTADRYTDNQAIDNFAVTSGQVKFTVPLDAPDVLYYVSETDPNIGGLIKVLDVLDNSYIDVETDILGKKTYKLSNGTALSNGMKVAFGGNVTPEKYATGEYYVEGVGTAITLIPTAILEIISPYSQEKSVAFDSTAFDAFPFSEAISYAGTPDYIVIDRGSKDHNPWSRYNRWFHQDVINASAIYNGAVPALDQAQRATRPIIEFEPDLRLYNFGNLATGDVDLVDTYTTDVFSTIEGSLGYNIDNVQLIEGMRVLFSADTDPLVANNVYIVRFVNIENNGPGVPQIHLELAATPVLNQTILVRQGTQYQGYMFWFNGTTWLYGQQKTAVNQAPMFDVVDNTGVSFSQYAGSTFKGTKLFSYKVGKTTADSVLGFSLSYQNINNIGDILFDFNLISDSFSFKDNSVLMNKVINTGYLTKLNYANAIEYVNGWETSQVTRYQAAVRIYKDSNLVNNFPLDIYDNKTNLLDLEVRIYINGTRLDASKWSVIDGPTYKRIKLVTDISLNDVLTIKAFAKQPINSNGYYEIPVSLQNNPLNSDMTNFTLGEVTDHVNSIIDNLQPKFVGSFPGNNNLRDLGNITAYGTKFVQHSGPSSLSMYHITSEENNVVKALEKSQDEYGKFKRNFISIAQKLGVEADTVTMVDLILKKLTANKSKSSPYYFSDMVPFTAKKRSDYAVVDYRITTYPLTSTFDNTVLSNKAVLVYIGTTQLLYGVDYTFTADGYVNISAPLTNGSTITVYEYDSTDGCFIPPTPTKLGLWPKYTPKIYTDTTYLTPQVMIQGHDGSLIASYGDYRDDLILELEKRIFNNIKVTYDSSIFDIYNVIPGYSRDTEYSLDEFNQVLAPSFYKWAILTGRDFTKPFSYDRNNSFTYNYIGHAAPDGREVPGYWRGIYRWMYDTDKPNIAPWEMLGFTEEPSWWTTAYGPAPYTNNNLVMWSDLAAGVIKEPGKATIYKTEFARPFLTNHIPVDESGNLISPIMSNTAAGVITSNTSSNYVFGDCGPVESAWRKSSYYPFSVLTTSMILKPGYTFGTCLDRSRIIRNVCGQLVYSETQLRVTPADVMLPSVYSNKTRVQTSGIINYLVDQIVGDNVNFYTQYAYNLANTNVKLSYRIGGFTDKNNFNLILDSKNPSATGSLFVPPEDYSITFNNSSPVKKISYSGVIITKLTDGFEIKGYSITQPFFKYYTWTQSSGSVNVGGISSAFVTWAANKSYTVGQIVLANGKYYRTLHNTISGSTFDSSSFQAIPELPVSGGANAVLRKTWDRTSANVLPYGTMLNTIQEVVDFLTGYGEYLKDEGFIFDDFNNAMAQVSNWETSAKEFMFWTTQNWSTGQEKWADWLPETQIEFGSIVRYNGDYYRCIRTQVPSASFVQANFDKLEGLSNVGSSVISLSPASNKLTFAADMSVVDDISNPFNDYEIFKVDGTPIHPIDLDSIRQGNIVSYSPRESGTIYNASFYLIQKEQVLILNNSTMFNDVIYSPTSGYRQERIKVSGFVSAEWFGGFEVPGFLFDRAEINQWQPWVDYALGDIVKYQSLYYSASAFTPGSASFEAPSWTQIAKPVQKLLPNWTYKAGQFTDYYNLDNDNFDTGQQKIAQHLVGYQKREFLNNIIQDEVSEFQFYQGYIREKGSQNSLNKLFDVLSADDMESLSFYEEWAVRTGQYGASAAFETIEFIIDEPSVTRNPQGFQLAQHAPAIDSSNFNITLTPRDLYLAPIGYNSAPFPTNENVKPFLRTGGHVKLDNDVIQLQSFDKITTQPISAFTEGTYLWVAFEQTSWNVYRFTNTKLKVDNPSVDGVPTHNSVVYNGSAKTITITTTEDIDASLVGTYIGIANVPFAGFYLVTAVLKNTITVSATVLNFPAPFTTENQVEIFAFESVRVASIDDANSVIKSYTRQGDKLWTDNDGTGRWANWQLNTVYSETELSDQDVLVNGYDNAIAWKANTNFTADQTVSSAGYIYKVKRNHKSGTVFNSNVSNVVYTSYTPVTFTINTPVTVGTYIQTTAGRVYLVVTAGTTSGSVVPSFTSGTQNNGTASLAFQYNFTDNKIKVADTTGIYAGAVISTDGTNGYGFVANQTVVSVVDGTTLIISGPPGTSPSGVLKFTQTGIVPYTWVYTKLFTENLSAYGRTISLDGTGTLAAVSTAKGRVIVFEKQGVTSKWQLRQVIESAFIAPSDLLNQNPNDPSTFGETLAMSADGEYLAIGSPNAGYPAVAVDALGNNICNASTGVSQMNEPATGAVSLYQKTSFNEYQLVMTLVSNDYGPGQKFGSSLAFGTTSLFIGAQAITNISFPPKVYELRSVTNGWKLQTANFSPTTSLISGFGTAIATTADQTTVAISAPNDNSVYIYQLLAGSYTLSKTITSTGQFGTSLTITPSGDYLAVGATLYTGSLTYQGHVQIYNLTSSGYSLYQTIESPRPQVGGFFGSSVIFMNDFKTLVVYSSNADISTGVTFDTEGTTFDFGGFAVKDVTANAGRVDIFDVYATKWICGETLITNSASLDGFGRGLAAANNRILVGAPSAVTGLLNLNLGKVFCYEKLADTYSWSKLHSQIAPLDLVKIKQAYLYNRVTNQLVKHLDIIDPYLGKIAGAAEQEITYKTFFDPAIYSQGDSTVNVIDGQAWTDKYVGKLWWDLRTAKFVDNHTEDLVYRNSTVNQLVNGASIDIYEWVSTPLLPADWSKQADTTAGLALGISGQPLYGNTVYSVKQRFDTFSKSLKNTYYYWVKNKVVAPAVQGRSISASSVANLIANPRGQGYQFLSLTGADSFSLNNVQSLIKDRDVALAIEYWTTDKTDQNIHNQWKLISNDPKTVLPTSIEQKWFDSLCGRDLVGRSVPDLSQPAKLRYGIEFRPRQTMFVNRFEALKQFVEQTNLILAANPIVEQKDISSLESYDTPPSAISGLYDSIVDTDAELAYASISLAKPAAITAVIVNGVITGINIISAGFGYLSAPTIEVVGTGEGAKLKAIINSKGQITGVDITSGGKGYDPRISPTTNTPYTQLIVRTYSVLVSSDSAANGNWSIYSYNTTSKSWVRTQTQSYDVRNFWSFADWYDTGYSQFSAIDFSVDTYNNLGALTPTIGQTVKVRTTGSGGWQLLKYVTHSSSTDWTLSYKVVGIENGTIKLSSNLYSFADNNIGYDGFIYDDIGFDYSAGVELRVILNCLKNQILTDTLKQQYLELFFTSVRYAFSEQTYIDWAFKTSFVKAEHNVGMLRQTVTYTNDNLSNFEDYVNEVVPYKTTVREYVSNYSALDNSESMISDFDLPAIYNATGNTVIKTLIEDGKIVAYDANIQTYPWKNWLANVGFTITEIVVVDGGVGYTSPPIVRIVSDSGVGATARAFVANGVVNRIALLTPGSGYLSAPTIILDGGTLPANKQARAVAIIGDGVARSSLIKMKFDRVTQQYFTIQLDKTESFIGTGSRVQFPLQWAPDVKIGQSTVSINNITQLRDSYTLSIVKSKSKGYTSYSGLLEFASAPLSKATISITYIKDIDLLNAADRIQYYYDPGTGALGKDLSQLMTGVDYGGVIVTGVDYNVAQGWNSVGYMSDLWDSHDNTFSDVIVAVNSTTASSHLFALPYIPEVYTNVNVYYSKIENITEVSDGVTEIYTFPAFYNAITAIGTINKLTNGISSVATATSTSVVTITRTISNTKALRGPTTGLVVGQAVKFIFGTLGGVVPNQTYYVYSIIDANNFTITDSVGGSVKSVTDSTGTMYMQYDANSSYITGDASLLTQGMPIQFTSGVFGGLVANQTYYVKVAQPTYFSVSSTINNGVPGNAVAVTYAQGSMKFHSITGTGSQTIQLDDTSGLKVGDSLSVGIAGAIAPGTVIASIPDLRHVKLNAITYGDIPFGSDITFTRELIAPVDYQFLTNTAIKLNAPLIAGAVLTISAPLDAVRLDDPNFGKTWTITATAATANTLTAFTPINFAVGDPIVFSGTTFGNIKPKKTYYIQSIIDVKTFTITATTNGPVFVLKTATGSMSAVSIANTNAIMQTYVADGRAPEIVIPATFNLVVGDLVTLRQSTSDGSITSANTDIDTALDGGNTAYSTATGLAADDILIDGDGFVTPTTSPATEEVVPGQVVDAYAIKVFHRPSDGSAKVKVFNYVANGTKKRYSFAQFINSKQAVLVKVGSTVLTNTVGYNVDYDNKQVILTSAPAAGTVVTISSFGFNGTNLLDLDYFLGDGKTNEFITNAEWQDSFNTLIYLNGVAVTPEIFKTDSTYETANRIGFRFIDAPLPLAVLNYMVVSGTQTTYSIVKTERLPTDGTALSFTLANQIGASLPLESNIVVRANQTILKAPNNSYFTIASNNYTYVLDSTKIPAFSVNTADLLVYANGTLLTLNQDYTVDTSEVSISINKKTYSAYKGTRLTISYAVNSDYVTTNTGITLKTAYTSNDYVEVISAYQHDILNVERTQTTISSNISFSSASANFYNYVGALGGVIQLQTTATSEDVLWVTKNGTLLTPSVDYRLNADLSSITLDKTPSNLDVFEFIAFTGIPTKPGYSFMQFKDMLNRTVYKRLSMNKQTRLAADLHYYDSTITVVSASSFDVPNPATNRPGIIEIHGERIEFFTINGNVLGQLRRGTLGTGTPALHKSGTTVQEIGPSETIPYNDQQLTEQVTIDGTAITNVIPLSFTPTVSADWALSGSNFEIFGETTTNLVFIKSGTSPCLVTFAVPQMPYAPATGKTLQVADSFNTKYNGSYIVASSDTVNSVSYVPTSSLVTGISGIVVTVDGGVSTTIIFDSLDDAGQAGTVYTISSPTLDGSYADQQGILTGTIVTYSFVIPEQVTAPPTGIYYIITGAIPAEYNGTWLCTASSTTSITLEFDINYGSIKTVPTSIASAHAITLSYPTDPGTFNKVTTASISAPTYGQADDIDVFVGGYDTSAVWTAKTVYEVDQIITINSYTYKVIVKHLSGTTFNGAVSTLASDGTVIATGVAATTVRTFFVGNIRLKKQPYSVQNSDLAPYSPEGDVAFNADFAVDGVNSELVLSSKLTAGTVVTIIRRRGTRWANDTGDLTTSQTPVANFIRLNQGSVHDTNPINIASGT